MLKFWLFDADRPRYPCYGKELARIVTQALDNDLKLKYSGGTFPVAKSDISRSSTEMIIISLKLIRRLLTYDPLTQTVTVEPGLTLKALTASLEYLDYTLELYGTMPDMTVADAINVGLIGSNGTMAMCVRSCHVVHADSSIEEWTWPSVEQIPGPKTHIVRDINYTPTLQSLVCGLGIVGIINKCTLKCVPMKFAQEIMQYTRIENVIARLKILKESLYANVYWFPLSDRVILANANLVRIRNAHFQPIWMQCLEYFCWGFFWVTNRITPRLCWYLTSSSSLMSYIQYVFLWASSVFRSDYSYKPQTFISVSSYCHGVKWVLPLDSFESTIKEIETWSKFFPYICTTPLLISMQTHQNLSEHQPFMCPYSDENTFTVWSDWFRSSSIRDTHSATMAEYEAILQKNGGRKCWSAGPAYASPLIGQMYPGFRHFCETRVIVDPKTVFRSSYVQGDIFGEEY